MYQLAVKQKRIDDLFRDVCPVSAIEPCEEPYYYRNKVHAAFKRGRGGSIIYGTYEKDSHRIVKHDKCLIENKKAQQIIKTVAQIAARRKMSIYNEKTGHGLLRRVLVRVSEATGQIMVVIVVGSKYFTGKNSFVSELVKIHPEITTVLSNFNDRRDSMILGSHTRVEYGKGYIEECLLGRTFRVSAESFLQVNTLQAEKLYSIVADLADIRTDHRILDCYCGTGTITILLSSFCREATGVELNPKAVEDARKNKTRNKAEGVKFICGDATEFMEERSQAKERYDTVVIDPPRSGTTARFISACARLSPEKVVYVSCNPDTLLRDVRLFAKAGYKAEEVVPVDMFPWTTDVECVVRLHRIDN